MEKYLLPENDNLPVRPSGQWATDYFFFDMDAENITALDKRVAGTGLSQEKYDVGQVMQIKE